MRVAYWKTEECSLNQLLVDVSRSAHLPFRLTQRRAMPYFLEPVWLGSKDSGVCWVGSLPSNSRSHRRWGGMGRGRGCAPHEKLKKILGLEIAYYEAFWRHVANISTLQSTYTIYSQRIWSKPRCHPLEPKRDFGGAPLFSPTY